jgi:hypothetical protein
MLPETRAMLEAFYARYTDIGSLLDRPSSSHVASSHVAGHSSDPPSLR